MDVILAGGFVRFVQGAVAAAPTLIVGLFIAALLRYYLGSSGTKRMFGGDSLRSLPQSWLIGMLLPVCSIGVIPIIREMRRVGVRPGAITAFALSAPLFNPLSLLYGLTLSRPYVILGFAVASLLVVTLLGIAWDRFARSTSGIDVKDASVIGMKRLAAAFFFMGRELSGPTGLLALIALSGLFLLGCILPHGALQTSVEQLDPMAPLKMALVAVPIYATPMLTMSQLGMMFSHGNSPGAAFCLLLLGTGMNLATLIWLFHNYGLKPTLVWFAVLFGLVLGLGYAVDRPLIPPGVEPAGHTHAFDIYTNVFHQGAIVNFAAVKTKIIESTGLFDAIGFATLLILLVVGVASHKWLVDWTERLEFASDEPREIPATGWNRHVSPRTVGATCLTGLVVLSIVACYAYYPAPSEVLEEMRLARVEVLAGATTHDYKATLYWIPILDEWSRKLEVGYALRHFELRPYQQMQAHLLRKKLELLEHATEHALEASGQVAHTSDRERSEGVEADQASAELARELEEISQIRIEISSNAQRLHRAFLPPNE